VTNPIDSQLLLAKVAAFVAEAKLHRDDNEYEDAIAELKAAIELIERSGWDGDPTFGMVNGENLIASNLADCLGMLGGNLRRLNRLDAALEQFERGRRLEADSQYGINSSYNLVNAITLPIEMAKNTATKQRAALEQAVQTLERQIIKTGRGEGKRRQDRWAWADYGQCLLLLGRLDEANKAYSRFKSLGSKENVDSHVTVLHRLRDALAQSDPSVAELISKAIRLLGSGLN
jgi:tetratricopeptide (TPR) repeat protein